MSWERKQPKRETTLARLTRQAKAIERLVDNHNKQINRESNKVMHAWERETKRELRSKALLGELETLAESIRDLELGDF